MRLPADQERAEREREAAAAADAARQAAPCEDLRAAAVGRALRGVLPQ
ncbi:hypothetical protein ACH4CE_36690 [Streptomyces gelaticus]